MRREEQGECTGSEAQKGLRVTEVRGARSEEQGGRVERAEVAEA